MPLLGFAKHHFLFISQKNSEWWNHFLKELTIFRFTVTTYKGVFKTLKELKASKLEGVILTLDDAYKTTPNLLSILKIFDKTLSITILTDAIEVQALEENLDQPPNILSQKTFLESPTVVLEHAVRQTFYNRRFSETEKNLKTLGQLQQAFQPYQSLPKEMFSFYLLPIHDVGGDFLNVFCDNGEDFLAIVGDVSGHNLESAFISAYFQGFIRGMLEKEKNIHLILETFNSILIREWRKTNVILPLPQSLSLCLLKGNISKNEWYFINCGFPNILIIQADGKVQKLAYNSYPLGWFEDEIPSFSRIETSKAVLLYACTDGLFDYALQQDINELALIYLLLQTKPRLLATRASDDILAMQINLEPHVSTESLLIPIFERTYQGNNAYYIDQYQDQVAKNLQLIFPHVGEEKMNHIRVCVREALLNAFLHGCKNLQTEKCMLRIGYTKSKGKLVFTVSDPGMGHDFSPQIVHGELFARPEDNHLGLAIINNLSQNMRFAEGGATISFDFSLTLTEREPSTEFSKVIEND